MSSSPLAAEGAPQRSPAAPPGTLCVVATPIGNLEDITLRALRALRECDLVVAEDTRHTRHLLTAHGIARPLSALPPHDERRRVPALVARLQAGEALALCTDAGTPGVSDPGAALIRAALDAGCPVVPIPGPSAVITALSASGMNADAFSFLGFLPRTSGRQRRVLEGALGEGRTLVFYESPHRLLKTLAVLVELAPARTVVVARELTKRHETFHRGTAAALLGDFGDRTVKGECTVLVEAGDG